MSDFLKKLDENQRKKSSTTESITIRITPEEDAAIKELMTTYEYTRQDLFHELIKQYLIPAWEKLESGLNSIDGDPIDSTNSNKRYYVFNTNKANNISDHKYMMENNLVAAFLDRKEKVDRFKNGDVIFLYESGRGIVAYGQADGQTQKSPYNGRPDETHSQKLISFKELTNPFSAKQICEILRRQIIFAGTCTHLRDGKTLLTAIEK